jgi:RNA polymerase sigma-70 factor (ECF subfamily)
MEEGDLILRSKDGDLDAFNQLVEKYQRQVYNLALRMLGEAPAAEDATQEAFLSAFRGIGKFRGGSFRAWLLRIAANACRDQQRFWRLAALPTDQRLAVILYDIEGLSYEEIARVMNSSLGTVRSRLSRGRARLRLYLGQRMELLP